MKNKTYIFGIICVLVIVSGALFKISHWPLAGILITLGLTTFSLVLMPVALINSYRAESDKRLKRLYIIAYLCVLIDCTGILFKIQHWPGAGLFIFISLPLPFVIFLPAYLLQIRKNKQLNYNNLLLVLFFFGYFASITALLSLNVSQNILSEYVESAYACEKEVKIANLQTHTILNNLSVHSTKDSLRMKSMQKIRTVSASLYERIKKMQLGIIEASGDNQYAIEKDGTINFQDIDGKDNKWIHSIELFRKKANELKKSLSDYKELLLNNTKDKDMVIYINTQLSTSDNWFSDKFDGKFMIAIMDALCAIKKNVALTALETINGINDGNL